MAATRSVVALVLLVAAGCTDDDDLAGELPAATQVAAITTVTAPVTTTRVPATTLPLVTATTQQATTSPALPDTTAATTACPALTPGVNDIELTAGGATHPVRVFVPSAYTGAPLPVVIDWHGLGSTGPQQAMYSGYESVAESEGFIVVHPTGVANVAGGPNSWQLFPAADGARDDVAFAGALIDELASSWCADAARVYSTGMSNGGFFTARLICEMSHRIAAAVSVAGTFHPESCEPARDVPYVAIHGTEDKVVPYAGGDSTLSSPDSPEELRVFFESVIPEEFNEFARDAGCDANINTDVGDDVIRHEYTGCDGDAPLIFFEVRGGGHTWPSSPMAALTSGALGYTTDDIDATRDGWAFMSQYTLAGV
ncbi:MAG TPA: PHB depolymerase family esterase [Ilumatobacter sp.]|nr:PHB depolymerase family esterase [Ilumatobacter sp.]